MYALLTRFTARYGESYMRAPFTTAFFSSLVIKGGGDVTAQMAIERRETWDRRRTAIMAVFACFVGGWGNAIFLRTVSSTFRPESMGRLRAALASAACDVFGFCPFFYVPSYHLWMATFQDGNPAKALDTLRTGYGSSLAAGMCVMGPCQVANFLFVPYPLRLPVMLSSAYVYNTALSVINMRAERRIGAA